MVLDTNVYISGIWWPGSKAAQLLVEALEGRFDLFTSRYQLTELKQVAAHPKFRQKPKELFEDWYAEILLIAHIVRPAPIPRRVLGDPADLPILGTAVAAHGSRARRSPRQR